MHTHILTEEQIECLRGCSQYPQYYRGRKGFEEDNCPFCNIDNTINTVLYDAQKWIAWEVPKNFTTRQSTLALQLVFFPKRHLRSMWELDSLERLGFFALLEWANAKYQLVGGGIISRFGDMRYNVGSIIHMHCTIMVPNRTGEVMVPLQKSLEMWTLHDTRMQEFKIRYEAGEIPEGM